MMRLRSVELFDFRNVEQGRVVFGDVASLDDIDGGAEVVGLFGQNGSGKTALIESLSVLQTLMRGEVLAPRVGTYIRADQWALRIKVDFFCAVGNDDMIRDYVTALVEDAPPHVAYLATYEVSVGCYAGRFPLVLSERLWCKASLLASACTRCSRGRSEGSRTRERGGTAASDRSGRRPTGVAYSVLTGT